jgi:hypothetical protein
LTEIRPLIDAALGLTERAAAAQWRGPDPYDALWWEWPRVIVGGRRRRQVVTQLHVRLPVDLRRLYRRRHPMVPKALALFASTGLRINALIGNERARQLALDALEILAADTQAGPYAWGYHWDVQTRWSFYPAGSPSVVNGAFVIGALLEAERDAGRRDLGDRARRAARWLVDHLWIEPEGFFAYHPHSRANIHNANLLGAWAAGAALGDDTDVRERISRAVERTLADQRPDGSWPYGEGEASLGWADSFHSGYILICLERLRAVDSGVGDAIARGARFYERFFDPSGEARLWANRRYPLDGHSAGTGLSALALLVRRGHAEQELLDRVARKLLSTGIQGGHVVFRRYRWGLRSFVHYIRWCDAHAALGLVDAALAISGQDDRAPTLAERVDMPSRYTDAASSSGRHAVRTKQPQLQ